MKWAINIRLYITSHVLMIFSLELNSFTALDSKEFQKNLPGKVIWAVTGQYAELPCDVTPALPGDNVTLIFWFKDNMGMPIYSLDARNRPLNKASHLAMTDDLGARSYFIAEGEPIKARLKIQNVTAHDQGVFRCRVDFVNSPTRNFQVNLALVVQPSAPRIFDSEGREVPPDSPAGPFLEGHELFLSCQVAGGQPRPSAIWFYNGTILDSVIDSSRTSSTIVNQLIVKQVPRYYKGARLECRTSSSDTVEHLIRKVPIIVFLKPNKVKIISPSHLLSTSKLQDVRCVASGSYPPAKLRWFLDGKPIKKGIIVDEEATEFSSSILSLKVVIENEGKDLVCQANNPRLPGGSAEDRIQIHVAYAPSCRKGFEVLRVGALPYKTMIFECHVDSIPVATQFSWTYNTSRGVYPIHDINMSNSGNMSTLHFTPGADDIESVSCWATNYMGQQQTPCIFHIVPADVPESPQDCIFRNTSYGYMEVACMPGKDGGLHQNFVLEISDIAVLPLGSGTTLNDQGILQGPTYRVLGEHPVFRLPNMESDREYEVMIYAENARGKSTPVVLPITQVEYVKEHRVESVPLLTYQENGTTRKDDPTSDASTDLDGLRQWTMDGSLLILVGLAIATVVVISCIVVVVVVISCRRVAMEQRREMWSMKPQEEFDISEGGFGDNFQERRAPCRVNIYGEGEQRILQQTEGPDLILTQLTFPARN